MTRPSRKFIETFLGNDKKWLTKMGEKALISFEEINADPYQTFESLNALEIGKQIRKWLIEFWISGRVVPMIISGPNAISRVREILGSTVPRNAKYGTIRNSLAPLENAYMANSRHRCLQNIAHAPETEEEAKREINIWFKPDEILD